MEAARDDDEAVGNTSIIVQAFSISTFAIDMIADRENCKQLENPAKVDNKTTHIAIFFFVSERAFPICNITSHFVADILAQFERPGHSFVDVTKRSHEQRLSLARGCVQICGCGPDVQISPGVRQKPKRF